MDRISELSDDLLGKILLFLPTKVSVSTSILSKRWEYLWMWLPKLEYGHRRCSEPESERLLYFLERNMPLHKAPVIESFRLEFCNLNFKPENIKMWVLTAVSHCLRELDILHESYPAKPNILPSNLYTCKSLVILKLDGDILLDVPRMVSLPSLKTLKLQSVRYLKDATLQLLLSNCPILEDLVVKLRRYGDTLQKLTVVVPSLHSLSLLIPYGHYINGYVIKTPSLKYIELCDYSGNDHYGLIENMPQLIDAYVDCCCPDIYSLVRSITSVKRLTICSQAILDGLVFDQLEHLEDHDPHDQYMDNWKEPSTVPECLLSTLQSLSWTIHTGEPQEGAILGYILKHAVHLTTATIKSSSESDDPILEMIKELTLLLELQQHANLCLNEYFGH